MSAKHLPEGLYDELVTQSVADAIDKIGAPEWRTVQGLTSSEVAERLIQELGRQLAGALDAIPAETDEQRAKQQVALINSLIIHLRDRESKLTDQLEEVTTPPTVLRAIHRKRAAPTSPEVGLAIPWLFTAGKGSPSLLSELRHELACCDSVDILVSFITVSGVRKLMDLLQSMTAIGADGGFRSRIRVLTTTYTGATEVAALDLLATLPGAEVKVSLDGRRTRLHAKAWIFRRETGFGSAYIGSANLSGAALMGGLEWTVKLTQQGQAGLFARAQAHFETLWNEAEFERYDPADGESRKRLIWALKKETTDGYSEPLSFFDLTPKSYQLEMLDQLALEREHGRSRNLVVAATGTGKTVVAAFDYRRSCHGSSRPRLLFVAHRAEILRQAQRTYREVLRDHSFGELLGNGVEPETYEHVFATIASVTSRGLVERFGAKHWHTVVIDECHRLAADSFDQFAKAVQPKILLGLTATPERADGQPIFPYFDNRLDGSPAVELRLWRALDLQLLCPFEYYGCDDGTDFSDVPWDRAAERDRRIDELVTGNDARARLIVDEWRRLCADPRECRALAFCVTVEHAKFMTRKFSEAGIPAMFVGGETDDDERRKAPERLSRGEVCVLVTCDLYNEGVDLPLVETLLLLRPTQSPVLFQQQIGRGLRLSDGKESCLILDFVGRHRADFRFDRLLAGITGLTRKELQSAVEHGFSNLPPGCHIHLQRQTRDQVLDSLRSAANQNWRRLLSELRAYATLKGRGSIRLTDFLRDQLLGLDAVYRDATPSGWSNLKREAGLIREDRTEEEEYFSRRFSALLHTNDPAQIDLLRRIAASGFDPHTASREDALRLQMFAYQIDGQQSQKGSGSDFFHRLKMSPAVRDELRELADLLESNASVRRLPVPGIEDLPFNLHASYGLREILTGVGVLTGEKRIPFQAGVLPLEERKIELLLATLDKSEGFHDRLAFHDYAISAKLFHWQTQNSAGRNTKAGRRYLESPDNGWTFQLFVRLRKGSPYVACGPVTRESFEGDRPISITWRLGVPLPARLYQEFSVLRGQ